MSYAIRGGNPNFLELTRLSPCSVKIASWVRKASSPTIATKVKDELLEGVETVGVASGTSVQEILVKDLLDLSR